MEKDFSELTHEELEDLLHGEQMSTVEQDAQTHRAYLEEIKRMNDFTTKASRWSSVRPLWRN